MKEAIKSLFLACSPYKADLLYLSITGNIHFLLVDVLLNDYLIENFYQLLSILYKGNKYRGKICTSGITYFV